MKKKSEEVEFYFAIDELKRLQSIIKLIRQLLALPFTEDYQVVLSKFEEKRRDVQNRLYFAWLREMGEFHGLSPSYMHGETKLEILQPMKMSWERSHKQAMEEQKYLDMVTNYEAKVRLSEKIIRTSEDSLTVKQFADFLTAVQQREGERGLALVCKSKDEKALSNDPVMTKQELQWCKSIQEMGCCACLFSNGEETPYPAIHHIVEGHKRLGHLWTIPLCDTHHQYGTEENPSYHSEKGKYGGAAAFEAEHGTQYELLEKTQEYVGLKLVDAMSPPTKIVPRKF